MKAIVQRTLSLEQVEYEESSDDYNTDNEDGGHEDASASVPAIPDQNRVFEQEQAEEVVEDSNFGDQGSQVEVSDNQGGGFEEQQPEEQTYEEVQPLPVQQQQQQPLQQQPQQQQPQQQQPQQQQATFQPTGDSPTKTCPGDSIDNCIEVCPSAPPIAFKYCVAECGKRCP